MEALGTWVEESVLGKLQKVSFFSVMADDCTDITTVEEVSNFCHWKENGTPVNASWKFCLYIKQILRAYIQLLSSVSTTKTSRLAIL